MKLHQTLAEKKVRGKILTLLRFNEAADLFIYLFHFQILFPLRLILTVPPPPLKHQAVGDRGEELRGWASYVAYTTACGDWKKKGKEKSILR